MIVEIEVVQVKMQKFSSRLQHLAKYAIRYNQIQKFKLPQIQKREMNTSNLISTMSSEEVEKFSKASKEWWDPKGQFSMLHRMNPLRVSYIRQHIEKIAFHEIDNVYPLKSMKVLDIGCGGGLLSEVGQM